MRAGASTRIDATCPGGASTLSFLPIFDECDPTCDGGPIEGAFDLHAVFEGIPSTLHVTMQTPGGLDERIRSRAERDGQ
jgi:hypothetical protein